MTRPNTLPTQADQFDPDGIFLFNEEAGSTIARNVSGYSTMVDGTYAGTPQLHVRSGVGTNFSARTDAGYITLPQPRGWITGTGVEFGGWEAFFTYDGGDRIFSDTPGNWYFDISGTHPVIKAGSFTTTLTAVLSSSLKDGQPHEVGYQWQLPGAGHSEGDFKFHLDGISNYGPVAGLWTYHPTLYPFHVTPMDLYFPLHLGHDPVAATQQQNVYHFFCIGQGFDAASMWAARHNMFIGATWEAGSAIGPASDGSTAVAGFAWQGDITGQVQIKVAAQALKYNIQYPLGAADVSVEAQPLDYKVLYTLGSATEVSTAMPFTLTQDATVVGTGVGYVHLATDSLEFSLDFRLAVLDDVVGSAPSSITVTVDGGRPAVEIKFFMDAGNPVSGQNLVYTTVLNSSGALDPTSISILATLGGQQGARTITATQVGMDGSTLISSANYSVRLPPRLVPLIQGADAQAIKVPGAVDAKGIRHWVFQDLLAASDGGIGSYILPINPTHMDSPHLEFAIKSHHTTTQDGIYHIFQAGNIPKEWTFSGVADSQEFVEQLQAYRNLNRRFYVIDHRNRAWKTVFLNVDVVPRLRTNFNGVYTDWFTDYTVSAVIVEQDPVAPA